MNGSGEVEEEEEKEFKTVNVEKVDTRKVVGKSR